MRYLEKSFTVPTAGPSVTQEAWDKIFGKKAPEIVEEDVRGCITVEPLKGVPVDVVKAMVEAVRKDIDADIIRDLRISGPISGSPEPRQFKIEGSLDNDEETDDTSPKETG